MANKQKNKTRMKTSEPNEETLKNGATLQDKIMSDNQIRDCCN